MKKKKAIAKYYYVGDKAAVESAQKRRLISLAASLFAFIVPPLFLPQAANAALTASGQTALLSAYSIAVVFTAALGVYCMIVALTRDKLGAPVTVKTAPRAGWNKRTFLSVEWYARLAVAVALIKLGFIFYAFSWWSLVLLVCSAGAAAFAVISRKVTFEAYKADGAMELREPQEETPEEPTETENAEKADEAEREETAADDFFSTTVLPKIKREEDEADSPAEDFYD